MKGKIISLILVFFISFSLVSGTYQKKVEASSVVLGYAAFKAGIAFTGFAAYAGMLYANGYSMGIQEMLVGYANKYYDYANGQYIAKGDQMSVLDKLNLATSAFLTGNDYLTYSELDAIKNSVIEVFPQQADVTNLIPDYVFNVPVGGASNTFPKDYTDESVPSYLTVNNQGFYNLREVFDGKLVKIGYYSHYPDYFYYADLNNYGWEQNGSYYYPTIRIIAPNGEVTKVSLTNSNADLGIINVSTANQIFSVKSNKQIIGPFFRDNYIPVDGSPAEYKTFENTFSDGTQDFIKTYPNYYSALSGKAATVEDLENLMNTDEYLQREITSLIENQAVNTQNELDFPLVDGGVITYPNSGTSDPDVPYVPGASWYDNILDGVTSIPDLFIGKMTDLIDNKITPALESLKNTVLTIPDLISNIWQWILDFPDLLYYWFVPTAPMIAETWDPVMDLWDLKLDPIIAPFKTLTFYETEYQDISVPLKFGSYEKEHKIIDFQYVKSQRDTIKSLIRAFLWILIIFFNLDQIHRLIRNQSLLNTYVRKIDKGA